MDLESIVHKSMLLFIICALYSLISQQALDAQIRLEEFSQGRLVCSNLKNENENLQYYHV